MSDNGLDIKVGSNWSMFTTKGNKRLEKIANDAVDELEEKARENKYPKYSEKDILHVVTKYLKKYVRLWSTKTYPESSDTAVREQVLGWFERLVEAAGKSKFKSRDLVQGCYQEAQNQVR